MSAPNNLPQVEEGKPLLEKNGIVNGTPVACAEPKVAPRRWRNHWLAIFGDCSPVDVSACCLAYHAPCVAFGWNQSRALQLSFWKEALRFILLTVGIFGGIHLACCAVMMLACPPPGDMSMDAANPVAASSSAMMAGGKPMMGGDMPMGGAANAVDPMMADDKHHHDWHDHGDHGDWHGHHHRHPMGDDLPPMTHECAARIAPAMIAIAAVAIAALVYVILFAARRRQAIRERFGIAGSFKEDVAMWSCCSLCALAQETRTLMHEQVHDGLWYGPVPTQQMVPAPQNMV